jgi:hypothetical protein
MPDTLPASAYMLAGLMMASLLIPSSHAEVALAIKKHAHIHTYMQYVHAVHTYMHTCMHT